MIKTKILLPLILVWSIVSFLFISTLQSQTSTASYGSLVTSLSTALTTAVSGTSFAVPSGSAVIITWTVVADGSALSAILEGSQDNTTWFTVDTQTTAAGGIKNYGFTGIRFVRISAVSRTGGTVTTGTLVIGRGFINSAGVTLDSPNFTGPVTTNNKFLAGTGTAALPSYSFTAFPTYGIFLSGGTALSHGGVEALTTIAGGVAVPAILFAALGTPVNGSIKYCSDCTITAVCAGAGTGAFAKRLNGVWVCN